IRIPQFVESRILLRLVKMDEAVSSLIGPAEFGFNPGQPSTATRVLLRLVEIAADLDYVSPDALAQAANFRGVFCKDGVVDYEMTDIRLDDCGVGVDILEH